jgi:hypothetical protein
MDRHLVLTTAVMLTVASMTAAIAITTTRTGTTADRRRVLAVLLQIALMGWAALLALLVPVG